MTILGIDGGGSTTTFLLVDENDREVAREQTGPSNYVSVGHEASTRAIQEGIRSLPQKPDVVCGGFGAAGLREGLRHYEDTLRRVLPDSRIITESDAFVAYVGAIGIRPGLLLIAGTGSIVIGRRDDGQMFRSGGWGPHFGDEGGGFWIGREAIRAALRSRDFKTNRRFRDRVTEALGLASIEAAVTEWASGALTVARVASLFPILADDYPMEPAGRILQDAAKHLRVLMQRSVALIDADAPLTSATGGIASHPLMQELIAIPFESPLDTPERGAILWARQNQSK